MRSRKVIVTRISEVVDPSALLTHPNVRGLWFLPRGYVLFEFYDPVFDLIYETEPGIARTARHRDDVKNATARAVKEEQKILRNLYQGLRDSSEGLMLLVPSRTASYNFLGRHKRSIAWPYLGCSPNWETAQEVRIAGRLVANIPETVLALESVLDEWCASAEPTTRPRLNRSLNFRGEYFTVNFSFPGPCGDATIALYMLLTDTRSLTSVESIGFFLLDDYSTPFQQIGSSSTQDQLAP